MVRPELGLTIFNLQKSKRRLLEKSRIKTKLIKTKIPTMQLVATAIKMV